MDNVDPEAKTIISMLESNRFGSFMDSRIILFDLVPSDWAVVLHPGLQSLGGVLTALAMAVCPLFDLFEPPPAPYHLHEAMQRVLLQEASRLLEEGPLPLNTARRRSFHSHFNALPTALRPHPGARSRKRSAGGFDDREDAGSRPRLTL
ncbi:hypothetical protein AURDEDRAFT_113292 [Auricularia subglabra TFB-10046 SS5]|nr:hypothetical protein AURDEDRAFT_113292 [Auricularia subglabra TFB-10046 SS5]